MMIIKIGGGKTINLEAILRELSALKESFLIVHGANALRDEIAEKLNQPRKVITSVSGYSSVFSDDKAIDVMMMAYSGLRNKRIVELCQQYGINAVGLCGLDGKLIRGRRNKGIRMKDHHKIKIIRDFSGKPQSINLNFLNLLLNNGYVPVLTVPIIDENNRAINSDNDDIITVLQAALQAELIFQFIEAPGLLKDPNDPNSLIKRIRKQEMERLEDTATGRIKRKMFAINKLLKTGAVKIIISDGRIAQPLTHALQGGGTVIQ